MTLASTNTNSTAYAYLQSLLQSGASASSSPTTDPLNSLMNAFYPNSPSGQTSGAQAAPPPPMGNCGPMISPDAMSQLISTQEQGGSHAQSLFSQMDANGDGEVSQSEFENVFGSGADKSKVDGLFNSLDSNGDGNVSSDEFAAAVQNSQAHHAGHHHHHHHVDSADGAGQGSDPLQQLLSGTSVTGATTKTSTDADGSTTTTISYADGSTVSMTTPPASSGSGGQTSTSGNSASAVNALEQMIKMQAQYLSQAAGNLTSTLATV